ncbi:MAG: IS4 family transposase [Saprospiraceae bacterium]
MSRIQTVSAESLINLIPESTLEEFALETQVDRGVKKFTGHLMFKLLLYSLLNSTKVSQRVIESFFNSRQFQFLMNLVPGDQTRHSTISERLSHVKVDFFQRIYTHVIEVLTNKYELNDTKSVKIKRFDSTTISLSSRLLHFGMSNVGKRGSLNKRGNGLHQIKFSIGFDGLLASEFNMYTEQAYLNEDQALSELILDQKSDENKVIVFDRGLQSRETFALLVERKLQFVTRVKTFPKYEVIEKLNIHNTTTPTVEIVEDLKVYLFSQTRKVPVPMRLIIAVRHDNEEILSLVTNIFDLEADQITEIYKKRWDIEVFFKFLKQEINFSHMVSRTQNGIQVMCYMTMIAAMLILIYRKINELKGFKLVKMKFAQELEFSLIKDIVLLCGGDPNRLDLYPLRT